VGASDDRLNWALELPKVSWNCVKNVGDDFEVNLGVHGDVQCGFEFSSTITLTDLVLVFGPTLKRLDVNYQQKCTGKNIPVPFSHGSKHIYSNVYYQYKSTYS
jgi:hypothetical protein